MNFDAIDVWLTQHPDWILSCIFGIAFLESLALVGLLSPGVALLFAAGAAAGSANLSYWEVCLAAYLGAVAGDILSFLLGAHFHQHVVKMPPFRQHPEWIAKAEAFFARYGLPGLFVGRFIGPLRPVLPMIAGALEMPFVKFVALNLCSGLPWAAVYLTPGYLVGLASGAPIGNQHKFWLTAALLCITAMAIAELLWRFVQRDRASRQQPFAALTVLAVSGALLITLYYIVLSQFADPINRWLAIEAAHLRRPEVDVFFISLTSIGDRGPMVIWGALVAIALLMQRAWWPTLVWVFSTLLGNALMHAMKYSLGIERPHLSQRVPEGFSFPSGHASMGLLFSGLLLLLAWQSLSTRGRRVWVHIVALYVMMMTASRLYLGAHWASDLLAGWALAAGLLALSWLMLRLAPPSLAVTGERVRPAALLVTTLVAAGVMTWVYILPGFDQFAWFYAPLWERREAWQ